MTRHASAPVRVAGTVVLRAAGSEQQVLLVHRPRHGSWSLPHGRLRPHETAPVAAVRETRAQTGFDVRLGVPLGSATSEVDGRRMHVGYWVARTVGEPGRKPADQGDETRWFDLEDAEATLAHKTERAVVRGAAELAPTAPLIIARHAKAMSRRQWGASDADRPLAKRGNDQVVRLADLLAAWSPDRVVSSPSLRCTLSIQPYAALRGTTMELETLLSEEGFEVEPAALARLVLRIRAGVQSTAATADASGVLLCTHRPLLPTIADTLGIPLAQRDRHEALPTAGCWVLHLSAAGAVAIEQHAV